MLKLSMEKKIIGGIRASLFLLGMIIITLVHASLSLCLFFLPWRKRYRFITCWSHMVIGWLTITCGIRYQIKGFENLPRDRSVIILSNHQSMWETIAFQVFLPPQVWVLKKSLLRIPFFGWALALLEPIAINRQAKLSAIDQIIEQGKKYLAANRYIIVFPEGTRLAVGQRKPFARGGAALAEASGHPVVPIAHNAGLYWPRHGFLKNPGTISVVIGPMIESQGRTAKEINQLAKTWIDQTLVSLENPEIKIT